MSSPGSPSNDEKFVSHGPALAPQESSLDCPEDDPFNIQKTTFNDAIHKKGKANLATANWFAVVASSAAFITDGYQNSLLTTGNVVFPAIYGKVVYNSTVAARVSNALLVGIIFGNILVGIVCDRVGRKAGIFITTGFIALGAILGCVAHAPTPQGLFWFLTVARGVVGIGTGGEYPATAAATIEAANQISIKWRGFYFLLAVFGFNILGGCLTYCVFLIMIAAQGYTGGTSAYETNKLEITWRVEWAVGVILPISVFFFRLKLRNSALFQKNAIKRQVPVWLYVKGYWFKILGVLVNYVFYQFISSASSTFSGLVIASVLPTASVRTTVEWQLFSTALSFPAFLIGALLVDRIPKRVQLTIGWMGYVVFGVIIGASYEKLAKIPALFFVMYALFLSVNTIGPPSLNGLIATEQYPTAIRASAYGLTVSAGKVAAIIGNYAFAPIKTNLGIQWVFYISAIISVVAIVLCWTIVPDRGGESFAKIDEEFNAYLREQGYKGHIGADKPVADAEADLMAATLAEK